LETVYAKVDVLVDRPVVNWVNRGLVQKGGLLK
jgi:hypothetical protein